MRLSVEVEGSTVNIDGQRGTFRGVYRERGKIRGAFVRMDCPVTGRQDGGDMVFMTLSTIPEGERGVHREILGHRVIDLAEFDRLNGIDEFRRECGWR